jgi:hypothetical protein
MIPSAAEKDTVMIASQAMTNTQTVTANLDTKGSGHATIRMNLGIEKNTNAVGPTISLLESDDTVVTNFATVVADRTTEDLTAAKEIRWEIDTRKRKRYLRLSVTTATATNDDIVVGAIASLSRNDTDPNTTTEQGDDVVVAI